MTDSPDPDPTTDSTADERPLVDSGESPERVEHIAVGEHDEVDQDALDIAASSSTDEPPA